MPSILGRERAAARIIARRAALDVIKRERGCVDCGTTRGVLDFDHRDGETKLFVVGDNLGRKWASLLAEIAKCDVRCRPCHALRHSVPKLTGEQVREIRAARGTLSQRRLAAIYGICHTTVGRIQRREKWRHT